MRTFCFMEFWNLPDAAEKHKKHNHRFTRTKLISVYPWKSVVKVLSKLRAWTRGWTCSRARRGFAWTRHRRWTRARTRTRVRHWRRHRCRTWRRSLCRARLRSLFRHRALSRNRSRRSHRICHLSSGRRRRALTPSAARDVSRHRKRTPLCRTRNRRQR